MTDRTPTATPEAVTADTGRRRQDALDTHRLIATCTHCHRIETREQAIAFVKQQAKPS